MVGYAMAFVVDPLSGAGLLCIVFQLTDRLVDGLLQAEKANGRAAMVGYAMAFVVDSLSGAGLVDQQNSFLGKLLLHVVVFAILIFRTTDSIPALKNLVDEATFYDKQWKATWEGQTRPVEGEKPSSS